jgi:hypothetical protein
MSGGRHPRIGIQWAAPSSLPAPTLWLPLTANLSDASANAFTESSPSLPSIDSGVSSPIGTGAALFESGSGGEFLNFADDPLLDLDGGDWFMSYWARPGAAENYPSLVSKGWYQSSTGTWVMFNNRATPNGLNFGYGNPWVEGTLLTGSTNFPDSAFTHIYIERSGNTVTLRSDGVSRATLDVTGVSWTNTHDFRLGSDGNNTNKYQGHIQDFVYCKGSTLNSTQITYLQTNPYTV